MNREQLEAKVTAIEAASAVEVVLCLQPEAGSYADVDVLWGALGGLAALAVAVHSPWVFLPDLLVLNSLLAGLLSWWLSRRLPAMRRLLTRQARRERQLQQFAEMAFTRLQLTHTRDRSGILLVISLLERRAVMLTDLGVTSHVPQAVLDTARVRLAQGAELEKAVGETLDQLAAELPKYWPRAQDDQDELSNTVRVLS
jgi:putative membrane protein